MYRRYRKSDSERAVAKAFLSGDRADFPFDAASLGFSPDDARAKKNSSREIHYAIRQSKRFKRQVRELEIVLATLLDSEDKRILDIDEWLPLAGNALFDIGIPDSGFQPVSPKSAVRTRRAYQNSFDDHTPYITDSGESIPIHYLSSYLSSIGNDISFLLPQHDLDDTRAQWESHMKGDLPVHTIELPSKRIEQAYHFFLRPKSTPATSTGSSTPVMSFSDIMQPVSGILSRLNDLFDHFVFEYADRKDKRFPKNISGLLGAIRSWKWDGSQRTITAAPEYEAFAGTVELPPAFTERWLPVYHTLRWFEHFINDYRKLRRRQVRSAERMGAMYTRMGGELAAAIASVNSKREALSALYLRRYEELLNPYALFTILAPGKTAASFIAYLSEIAAALGQHDDTISLMDHLRSAPHPALAIDAKVRDTVRRFAENITAIPVLLREVTALEDDMRTWYSGDRRMQRPVTIRELLTGILVPRTGWVKNAIEKLKEITTEGNETLSAAVKEFIGIAVFAAEDAPEQIRGDIITVRDTALAGIKDIRSIALTLTQITAASTPPVRAYLSKRIFLCPHEIRLADMIIKMHRHSPAGAIDQAIDALKSLTSDWPPQIYDGAADHFHRAINDSRFDALQKALEDFGRNELFIELKREWSRIANEHDAETQAIAARLMEKGKLTTVAEQQRFLDERHALKQKKRDEAYHAIMAKEDQSGTESTAGMPATYTGIQKMLRSYLRPGIYWSKELFELMMMREYTAEDIPRIEELTFAMYTHHINRIRFCHRFSENGLPDPNAVKHMWPYNPCTVFAPKNDLPSLDGLFNDTRTTRHELDPIHTPASIRAIIGACEMIFPQLFRLKRGAKLQYHDTLRRYDQSPPAVIITPPGVRPMREIPFSPRYFAGMRARAFGSISRSAFHAREWNTDIDHLYTGATYDPRYNTLIISADADETNLFHYILAADKFSGNKIFSSIFMALGMMVYHRLPEYYRTGDFGDNSSSWKSCLLQSRAAERIYFTNNSDDGRRFVAAQTSHLTYNVPLHDMTFDYYVMELEFASYFSEILLELLSGAVRNPERPGVVDYWFSQHLPLHSLRTMSMSRHSGAAMLTEYTQRKKHARTILLSYLGDDQ